MSRFRDHSEDDSDFDIRVSHRHGVTPARTAPAHHYVEARDVRRRTYYDDRERDRYLVPAGGRDRTVVTARSRSRDHRSHQSSSPSSSAAPAAPVIINNKIYNFSDSDSDLGDEQRLQVAHHRSRSRAGSSSYRYEKNSHSPDYERERERIRQDFELERTQKELQELRLVQRIEKDEEVRDRSYREEQDLKDAKKELDAIRRARDREEQEKRIKQKIELDRLKQEEEELAEKKRREKEAKEAVEKYKKNEAERRLKEKQEAEERDREYKQKMQEHLLKSGLGEKEINAILEGKKIEKEKEKEKEKDKQKKEQKHDDARPTYTRMARRHLSIETLRIYNIDYQLDMDPEYVLIKRWVTESEQDMLWGHTKMVREQRSGKLIMTIEDKKHHHRGRLEPENFEWVRKKERKRSKSPALLMYLAGQK